MRKTQLFLLHFAGGNCYSFQFMIPFLKDFSVFPLELPGRGDRINESLQSDLNLAAEDLFFQISNKLDGSDFIIYGHSMGATLGLKVTELLEKVNRFPSYLFVSGNEGPTLNKKRKRYLLDDDDLIEELTKLGGIPLEILEDRNFLNFYLPIVRSDLELVEKEAYFRSVIKAPIFAIMGDTEEEVDKISNWNDFTNSTFKSHIFQGGHFFIHKYPGEIVDLIVENYSIK